MCIMNIFVLSTGRCGSSTFARACEYIENYSVAHESRISCVNERVKYPNDHIEVDNHLAWFLGRLDEKYGDDAFYVHLKRDLKETAKSRMRREEGKIDPGLVWAYSKRIIWENENADLLGASRHYCETVNANIRLFLKDKSMKMEFSLESAEKDFRRFWKRIEARGDLASAVQEWDNRYNATDPTQRPGNHTARYGDDSVLLRAAKKVGRAVSEFPDFIRDV